ncbi:MAG: hypothetical protein JNM68_14995, partial [Dinghuibacter sp.]|nr:hypothetical protein [Dinghuibacter sp.]
RAVLCEQQQITYVHNAALTFNEEHIQAEQEQAQRAGYWANLYEQVRTPNWPVLTAPMNSGQLQEHTFCLNETDNQTLQQLAQTNDTSLNTVLLALTETVLGTLLNGEPFTLHTITSYRARYEHTVTANLLYYVPINFSAPATTVAAAIPLAKNRLAEMIDHLPLAMPQERVSPRPVMTLNITTATPVTPNSATANTRISIQPFNGVIHRERFPLNISMVAGEQLVHITVSALPGIPITGTGFETTCRQLLKNL